MFIKLSPQVSDGKLSVEKSGDVLTINGVDFDFSVIPDGASLPADSVDCPYVIDTVSRVGGVLRLTLLFPIPHDAPEHMAFPQPLENPADGPLPFPREADTEESA